jgi:hypothetical protein|nr:MAG TPA: hypothetical protein [Caudoviricetes sp.]DAR02534.1 MAG TPA: hypothetical protein [Caudoviricetes sp.]
MAEINLLEQEKNTSFSDINSVEEAMNISIKEHMATIQDIRRQMDEELSSMDVHDYINNYLARHCGFVSTDDPYDDVTWLEFAGGVYRPVNLTHKGKIVAQVPSIYPDGFYHLVSADKETVEPGDDTVGGTLVKINQYAENYHELGTAERKNYFDALASRVSPEAIEAHKQKWKEFFKVMGVLDIADKLKAEETPEKEEVKPSTQAVNNVSLDFISDDEDY